MNHENIIKIYEIIDTVGFINSTVSSQGANRAAASRSQGKEKEGSLVLVIEYCEYG